ncbi:hypothetical protein FF1_005506 [Malus domestica]
MSTGLCLGAHLANVNLVTRWAVDYNEYACKSLEQNHPQTEKCSDIGHGIQAKTGQMARWGADLGQLDPQECWLDFRSATLLAWNACMAGGIAAWASVAWVGAGSRARCFWAGNAEGCTSSTDVIAPLCMACKPGAGVVAAMAYRGGREGLRFAVIVFYRQVTIATPRAGPESVQKAPMCAHVISGFEISENMQSGNDDSTVSVEDDVCLDSEGSEDQRIENSPKIVSNRGLGQKALEFERAPHNRGGLKGWPLPASQVAPG